MIDGFAGITPYYVGATWYGFDQKETIPYSLSNPAATIWSAIMDDIHENLPSKNFDKPDNIVTARVCKSSGKSATGSCTNTYIEEFVEGTVPEACNGHQHIKVCKETGKLATEFCKDVEERTVLQPPEKEKNATWKTSAGNKYNTVTENCDVHKKTEDKPNNENNNQDKQNNQNGGNPQNQQQSQDNNVKVPKVVGLTESAAKELLSYYSLKCNVVYVENNDSIGLVSKQDRASGVVVPKNTVVTITVNKKKEEKTDTEQKTNTNTEQNTTTNTTQNTSTTNTTQNTIQENNTN